jgi:hypothetical protein
VETGEHRWQRTRDRRCLWAWRAATAAAAAGFVFWLWLDGAFEESWQLVWMLPLALLVYILWEGLLEGAGAVVSSLLKPLARPFSSQGYSYYDEELRDPSPDYSMAEVIIPDGQDVDGAGR